MRILKRLFSLTLVSLMTYNLLSISVLALGESKSEIISNETVSEMNAISDSLIEGDIDKNEMDELIIEFYGLSDNTTVRKTKSKQSVTTTNSYYPEKQVGYINYDGVKYLYTKGLSRAKTAQAAISYLISTKPGAGWGLGIIGVVSAYGGKSALEQAVNKAYFKKKGIKVYYKIHKAVQSYNQGRYVVG